LAKGELFNPRNKKFWFLVGAALLGVVLMLLGGSGHGEPPAGSGKDAAGGVPAGREVQLSEKADSVMTREEKELAAQLRRMLGQISGAGRVEVTVQLASSTHNEYAINTTTGLKTTEEKDQSGGSRQITENTGSRTVVIARSGQGLEEPVVEREVAPEVAGVLVVAEGASVPWVKASLFQAIQVALGVEPHRIIVLPMQRSEGS